MVSDKSLFFASKKAILVDDLLRQRVIPALSFVCFNLQWQELQPHLFQGLPYSKAVFTLPEASALKGETRSAILV